MQDTKLTLLHIIASLDGAALITVLLLLTSLALITATILVKCELRVT